jgi:HIRAN domain
MRSYPSWIAGLRYRGPDGTNRGRYCRSLNTGMRLELVPEPDNPHDAAAIAITHCGHHLGYIPARHSWIAAAIGEGRELSCFVRAIEVEGWLFRRASFVGLVVTVEDGQGLEADEASLEAALAAAELKRRLKPARQACIDGLRVLAFIAMADNEVTPEEVNVEISYIEARLVLLGIERDASLTDALLALSQGLSVTKRSLTRAVNLIAADREHYRLILHAVLQLADIGGDPKGVRVDALQRLKKAGKKKGWI